MRRVVKLGGSLLTRNDLPAAFRQWLAAQPAAEHTSVLVGGGQAVDAMRQLDQIHQLDAAAMHWRCVRLLRATFEIAAELWPELTAVGTVEAAEALQRDPAATPLALVAVDAFFHPHARPRLPESWQTTSDAIAAHLAHRLQAEELVLLKRCAVPDQCSGEALAQAGLVDAAFPAAAAGIARLRVEQLP